MPLNTYWVISIEHNSDSSEMFLAVWTEDLSSILYWNESNFVKLCLVLWSSNTLCTYIYLCLLVFTVFVLFLLCVVVFFRLYIFILICFVCASVGTTATEWNWIVVNNNSNNNNNNNNFNLINFDILSELLEWSFMNILACFVCNSVGTTATEWNWIVVCNSNNNNNNNNNNF